MAIYRPNGGELWWGRGHCAHVVADTLQSLALASWAFAFYYLIQCLVAIRVATSGRQKALMTALAFLLGFVTIFAVPAG